MRNSQSAEICIVGAGPAGAAAALTLARRGIPSVVVEKSVFPRDKVCGDAFSGRAVEAITRLNPELVEHLHRQTVSLTSQGVLIFAPNLKGVRIPFHGTDRTGEQVCGFVSKRRDFDSYLASELKKSPGIRFLEGCEVRSFSFSDGYWTIGFKEEKPAVTARIIIAADGANSRFAREVLGKRIDPRHSGIGVRTYYTGVKGLDPEGFIELYYLRSLLPGYLWIFPLPDGTANVGAWSRSDRLNRRRLNLERELDVLLTTIPQLRERFSDARTVAPPRGSALPLGLRKANLSGPHYMLAGDAASLIDPFTGEGIGNAMVSGELAARQAARSLNLGDFSERFMRGYDARIRATLGRELRTSRRLQQVARHPHLFNIIADRAQKGGLVFKALTSVFQDLDRQERMRSPISFIRSLLFR